MNVWLMENRSQAGEWFGGVLRAERTALTLIPNLTQLGREFQAATPDLILISESHPRRDAALSVADEAGYVLSGLFRPQDKPKLLYHWRIRVGAQKPPLALLRKLGESWETRGAEASVHERYRKLLNRVSDGILELDAQDLIRWSNTSLQKSLAVDDLVGLSLEQIVKPSDVAQLRMLRRQHQAGVVAAVPVSLVNGQMVELDPNLRLSKDGSVLGSSLVLRGIRNTQDSDRGRELFVLYTVATLLSQAASIDQALETVLQRSIELMDLAAAGAWLDQGPYGNSPGLVLEENVRQIIGDLCRKTMQDRKSLIYRHLNKENEGPLQVLRESGVLGLAIVPLQVQGRPTGCLWFVSTDPGHFSREVVSLLISLSIPMAVAIDNFRHVAEELQEEASRRQFYRDALQAVTRGKLFLCEPPEFDEVWAQAGVSAGERPIRSYADVPDLRHFVEKTLGAEGFTEERCHDMALCATEAAGNVVKHAESGRLEIRVIDEEAFILIEDKGPGISFSNLPNAVLTAGYSTAPSLGMGYSILLEMADALYLCTHPGGTSVMLKITRKVVDPLEAFAAFELL
jgi:anti-sigma regulatory factor (Ser/Thr protein kinase)/PAS domain-containing protein